MIISLIQILLGIGLLCTVNWIGKHSYSLGYTELPLFVRREEAPAFNYNTPQLLDQKVSDAKLIFCAVLK
jgi:hypothetical protein